MGFGWTWVVLGDGVAGAERLRSALAAADTLPRQTRAPGLLVAGWLEASAGNLARARADLDEALQIADELADSRLRADADRHRAFLSVQPGRPADVLDLASSSINASRALGVSWETAAALVLRAYGSIMLRDTAHAGQDADEAIHLLDPLEDSWGLVHAEAMLGAIAQAEHRFGTRPSISRGRPPSPSFSASSARPPCISHRSAVFTSAPEIPTPRSSR